MNDPLQYLLSVGFDHAETSVCMSHFGDNDYKSVMRHGEYLFRKTKEDRYQYIFLCRYEGKFLEGVFEEYLAPKNTRVPRNGPKNEKLKPGEFSEFQKKGFSTVDGNIFRKLEQFKSNLK